MKKYLILALSLMLSGLLVSLTSYNASALDLTNSVTHIRSYTPNITCQNFAGQSMTLNSNTCIFGINTGTTLQGTGIAYIETDRINLVANDFYEVYLDVSASSGAQKHIPVIWNLATTANYDIVDFAQVSESSNQGTEATTEAYVSTYKIVLKGLYNNSSFPIQLGFPGGGYNFIYLAGDSYPDSIDVRVSRVNQYRTNNSGLTVSDIISAINQSEVNRDMGTIKNNTQSILNGVNDLNSTMESLNDNEGRVADVAEDEYNQTQEDREQASSDANGFAFNFSLPNPFSIFQVSDGCVSTPTIDSWLHLEGDWKSPHCPIIPADVRNTLTPIVTLIVSLASLMVVIRWVSSSNVGVSDDIGQGGYSNSLTAKVNADKIRRAK